MKKIAYWIYHTHAFRNDEYECSACGEIVAKPKKICPNCGATMKGSKGDIGWADEMEAIDAFFRRLIWLGKKEHPNERKARIRAGG